MWRRSLLLLVLAGSAALGIAASCSGSEPSVGGTSRGSEGADDPRELTTDRFIDRECDEATIGDDGGSLVAALAIVDGSVAGSCAGDPDERLDVAWDELIDVVPEVDLSDLGVFAGFDDPASDVMAFATLLGESNERFAIVVNLSTAEEDPDEFRLTLAHEVSHVFTQTADQLDVAVDEQDCPTLHNGNGCFLDGSLMLEWIEQFWSTDQLASMPDPTEADERGGDDRCSLDPGFLGAYAASSPEEDFAESFSAYVFDLDVPEEVRPRLEFFEERPEFVRYREMAEQLNAPANTFDECGVGG